MEKSRGSRHVVLLSLDAFSMKEFGLLSEMKHTKQLLKHAAVVTEVDSVFITNTYPIHTSVVTGCNPGRHGVIANTRFKLGDDTPDWYWQKRYIKVPTIYDAVKKIGGKVLSIMWPVTAQSGIQYNIPEIFANRPWKHQITESLRAGSPLFSIEMFLKYGKNLQGVKQPNLDDFATNAFCEGIRRYQPDLMMLHLTDTDSMKHEYGVNASQVLESVKRMDQRIGHVIEATKRAGIWKDTDFIVFSDHGQLDVGESIDLNKLLEQEGLLSNECCFEMCSGSAFAHTTKEKEAKLRGLVERNMERFKIKRFLTEEEMKQSGYFDKSFFGVTAMDGYDYAHKEYHKATHGYTLDREQYKVFYLGAGPSFTPVQLQGGSLLDVCPLVAHCLRIGMTGMDGKLEKKLIRGEN